MVFTETFTKEALAPLNFDLTAQIFRSGDRQIRAYSNGVFHQVLNVDSDLVLAKITSNGKIEKPKLVIELKSNSPITHNHVRKIKEIVDFSFNLNFNLCSFYKDIKNDSVMNQIIHQLYGLKNPTTLTVFESLVDSIVEQQISIKVAHVIEQRLTKKFGDLLQIDGNTFFAYPVPQNIAAASLGDIQQVGLSMRKAEYIHGVAQLIADGKLDLEGMKNRKNSEQIVAELDEIKGIGVWTAELTMLRGLQRLDVLPADDLGIRRVISKYYCSGKRIKAAEARQIATAWGKWKGLAAFYLIIAEVKSIVI
jgi:DNA-3-methyladenine glycosylase II